jgi:hypothetical protein
MNLHAKQLVLALPLAVALAACDSVSGSDDSNVSVSFAVAGNGNGASSVVASAVDPITLNGHTLDLQSVDVTFSQITLDRKDSFNDNTSDDDSDNEADTDSEGDDAEEEDLRFGTTTVALPLNGGVITPITVSIPTGTFESIELKISTVRLRGTFDGNAFDVTVPVNTEIEHEFSPVFVVASDTDKPNITIAIDTSLWFKNNGNLINPSLLATNSSLREFLRNQVRRSFHAFEDADKDADEQDSDSDSR